MRKILFLVICGLFSLRGEASAQVVNSVDLDLEDKNKSSLLQGIVPKQSETETIPFILEERLFDGGEEVLVSLRVFDILQHFIAVPNISYGFNRKDSVERPVIDLKFKEPGTHYASWDRLDQQGNKVATGIYFAQLSIESEIVINDADAENEVIVARRGGFRGFLNKISPGDPFKENVSDPLSTNTYNSVIRIVIN